MAFARLFCGGAIGHDRSLPLALKLGKIVALEKFAYRL
jgi:hypothetical protein